MMKKTAILMMMISQLSMADDAIREDYNPKPLIEGNTRAQELMDWDKDHPGEMPPLTDQEKYEFFTKKGMPIPGTGATVVETKSLTMSKDQSNAVSKFNEAQRTKGYYESANSKAKLLLEMPEIAEKEYNERKLMAFDARDTHLYESKNILAMNYVYKGIDKGLTKRVIGYAPESTFVNEGWTGAVEFFVPLFDGVCAYHEVNIGLTKTSAYIPKEVATYKVNDKLTTISAAGNSDTGYVYEVEWWDDQFKHTLECAEKTYSESYMNNAIELANSIDKQP